MIIIKINENRIIFDFDIFILYLVYADIQPLIKN